MLQPLTLPSCGGSLLVAQEGLEEIGGVAWDCGRAICHLLLLPAFRERLLKNLHVGASVVELGSGTGLVGLQMAAFG